MKRIIISIPLVWGIRNFILSGIAQNLRQQYEIFYAIPEIGKAYMLSIGIAEEQLVLLKSQKYNAPHRWCFMVLREAHRRRFPTASDEVFKPITQPVKKGLRGYMISFVSILFSLPLLYRLLERIEQRLFVSRIDADLAIKIEAINPGFALSTSFVVNTEWPLFRILHARQTKVYTHVLSFDNLTSRGYLPIKFFDTFLVWNKKMANELHSIYAIPSSKIAITGTPQFDFHTHPKYLRSRDWIQTQLGIVATPYLVYCANHHALTPDEPQLVENIIQDFGQHAVLRGYQFVLRLHPMDNYDRWNPLLAKYPSIHISYPWPHRDKKNIFWGEPTVDDLVLFSNTLRYSGVVINIASTISIDAAILDKPVVCVGFSSDASNKLNSLYNNFHYSDHYAPIMKTGATPLSTDLKSLQTLCLEAVQKPADLSEKRKEMVELLCGNTDGKSAERIVNFLTED